MNSEQLLHAAKKIALIKKHLEDINLLTHQRKTILNELFGILDNLIIAMERQLKK